MKLSDALSQINGKASEKTAAAASTTPAADAPAPSNDIADRLKVALQEATTPDAQKTAAQASPTEDLTKIASDLSKAEHDNLVKEAQLYGASVADGFMLRLAQYNEAAQKLAAQTPADTKVAAEVGDFQKFAAENPQLVKDAAQLGYDTTITSLEKLSSAAYDKGWNDTVVQIHKTASDAFVAGFKFVTDHIQANAR